MPQDAPDHQVNGLRLMPIMPLRLPVSRAAFNRGSTRSFQVDGVGNGKPPCGHELDDMNTLEETIRFGRFRS